MNVAKMLGRTRRTMLLLVLLGIPALPTPGAAAWPTDPAVNLPIRSIDGDQQRPSIVSDGEGGAIIAWHDNNANLSDIRAQRVNATGALLWDAEGVAVCTASNIQDDPVIVTDGSGGAILAWTDYRSGTGYALYVQHVDASGIPQWDLDGVLIRTAGSGNNVFRMISDGLGGAIVAWSTALPGSADIYAQHVDASGAPLWPANGLAVCVAQHEQLDPALSSDGAGGARITWSDRRLLKYDIYAQWMDADGNPQWATDGVAVCTAINDQLAPAIVDDGAGGAIVTWQDERSPAEGGVYAQRIDGSGTRLWMSSGVALCTAANDQLGPVIATDSAGGAVVMWFDSRNGTEYHIYGQRVDPDGVPQWDTDGVGVCTFAGDQRWPDLIADGTGNTIVTWYDSRGGLSSDIDIYAQRLDGAGAPVWDPDGLAISIAPDIQVSPRLTTDGSGGAIIAWPDNRNDSNPSPFVSNYDIYAQRVLADGTLGDELTAVTSAPRSLGLRVSPNPASGAIRFALPTGAGSSTVEVVDLMGRRLWSAVAESGEARWSGETQRGSRAAPGIYLVRVSAGAAMEVRLFVWLH